MSVLQVKNVSIRYLTGDFRAIGLKEYVMRKLTGDYHVEEFWADRDVNFSLEKGDMLGIIGTNGAGKSTLLKVISGIMEPTKGWVEHEGNIAALLELGSGFDGDLTVRENTYLRGAMLGYTRSFMDEMYDQIIDFAELRNFQDRPFRQLSSGMKSRLAFSIASLVQPDILILDEVLSVGDGAFRKKSAAKMREIIQGGAATILVSHSVEQVRELCNKVLWLHEGRQVEFGSDVQGICDRYQDFLAGGGIKLQQEEPSADNQKQPDAANSKIDAGQLLADKVSLIKELFHLDLSVSRLFLWFAAMLLICSGLLFLTCAIPDTNIDRNIEISAAAMAKEGKYPEWVPGSIYYRIDNWTEAALLNMIYMGDSSTPVQSAFAQKEYCPTGSGKSGVDRLVAAVNGADPESGNLVLRSTYWLGIRIFLIPLLAITDYYSPRPLLLFLNFALIFLTTLLLSFKVNKKTGIAFFLSILMLNYYTTAAQWCNGFLCMWIAVITLLPILSKRNAKLNYCTLFFVVGVLTSYFDWFSLPLITFGIPVIIVLMLEAQRNPSATICTYFNKAFRCAFGWCLGYAAMLVGRAVITTAMNGDGSWKNFSERVIYNITSSGAAEGGQLSERIGAIVNGFRGIFPLPIFSTDFAKTAMVVLVCLVAALTIIFYKKIPVLGVLGLISAAPFVWFWFFNGYCRVHYWIAFRIFTITVFSWILIFCLVFEHCRKKLQKKKSEEKSALMIDSTNGKDDSAGRAPYKAESHSSDYDSAISMIRMIATILVFLCHALEKVGSLSKKPVIHIIGNYCSVGVPIFLIISGYMLGQRSYEGFQVEISKTGRRIKRVLFDFYVYSIVAVVPLYWILAKESVTLHAAFYTLMGRFSYPQLVHFWYIPYILLCYLITPILKVVKEHLKEAAPSLHRFIASWGLIFVIMFACSKVYRWYFTPIYLFCYIVGFCLHDVLCWNSSNIDMKRILVLLTPICIITNGLKIYCKNVLQLNLEGFGGETLSILYDVSHLILGLELFLLVYVLSNRFKASLSNISYVLKISDKYSYDFYIVHMLYVKGFLSVMGYTRNYVFNIALGFLAAMLSAIVLKYICGLVEKCFHSISIYCSGAG